jgi:hypothetical protein
MVSAFSYSSNVSKIIPSFASEKRSLYNTNVNLSDVQEPITSASPEVRQLLSEFYKLKRISFI